MPPRFHVIYLSLVALVCTLVGAKDSELAQSFQETVQQIDALKEPVDEFAHNIQDVAQINGFRGYYQSCDCINTGEDVDEQCPAVTSCLDHVYSMTRYLSHFYDLLDEFLSSSRETTFDADGVKCNLENLQTSIINYTIINYTTPDPDSTRLEITCTDDEDECYLESKLGYGLSDWLAEMKASMNKLANVTGEVQDLQTLLDTCHVTSRTVRSNKKGKKGKKGKGKKNQSKKERKKLERQRKKKARKAERQEAKREERAKQRAADKAARAARKAEKKQKRAQQHNEN